MKIGIIGSGTVGRTLAQGLLEDGNQVAIGSRTPEKVNEEIKKNGGTPCAVSNEEAAKFGELIILCTKWEGAKSAIDLANPENLKGKLVIDTTNPLQFEQEGHPPSLAVAYPQSAGQQVQDWLPESKVVKCFNIVTAAYMLNPNLEEGKPDMFVCGNDPAAKKVVMGLVSHFGWDVHDLGDISQSYLMESLAMLWIRYGFLNNHWTHAFKLLKK